MAKFVLIDHSIVNVGGHYYEYAVRVLRAAEEAGYEPVLATNRRLREVALLPWRIVPVYRYDFFEPKPPRLLTDVQCWFSRLHRRAARLKYRFLFSPLALWLSARCPRTRKLPRHQFLALVVIVSALLHLVRQGIAVVRFVPARSLSRACRRLLSAVRQAARPLSGRKHLLMQQIHAVLKRAAFAADTRRLFRQVTLGEGDIVFIPTLAEADMLGLLPLFRARPETAQARWHLIFRRNIYQGREPAYAAQDRARRPLKKAFRCFQSQLSGQRVFFYTDTDALTAQYNRLGVAVFQTLPIPVAADYQEVPNAQRLTPPLLHVVYLGDARTEKGYHLLPHLVSDAYAAGLPVHFTVQSNFNVPGGEPAALVARAQLEALPEECRVALIDHPLTSDEYRRLLLDADVVVIPYDRDNYYSRSSGVFAEALVAGKPVIVPAGTWMAENLPASGVGAIYNEPCQLSQYLHEVVTHYEHYRTTARDFAREWSRYHCPQMLLEFLLRGTAREATPGASIAASAHRAVNDWQVARPQHPLNSV